jgi:hypothetical protein
MSARDEFEWDEDNEGHIAPDVEKREAQDDMRDPKRVRRREKIRVVTAREAVRSEKRRFRKR